MINRQKVIAKKEFKKSSENEYKATSYIVARYMILKYKKEMSFL